MSRSYEIDMVSGPLLPKVLFFSLPLMLSGILQLLFNAADIIVVGQFTGSNAMAAVGATSSLNTLIVNIFLGLSIGSSILMSRYFGARDNENMSDLVHTSVLLAAVSGILLVFVGLLFAPLFLTWMGTPEEVLPLSVLYMRIVFLGMPALLLYDFGAGILRAIGDTRRPLYFLFFSGIVNVVLNLLLVIVFSLGVAGVAIATIISQYISSFLVMRTLMKEDGAYHLELKKLHMSGRKVVQIFRIGIPAGVSGAVFSISNVLIQSSINSFGPIAMAGNAASSNIEGFVYTAMNSLYQAAITFVSQNVGAGKKERIIPVFRTTLFLVIAVGLLLGGLATFFASFLLSIYSSDQNVIAYGMERLHIICLTYFLCGMMDVACGINRGMGYSVTPTVVSLFGACILRVIWIFTIFKVHHSLFILYLSYPVSWIVTFLLHLFFFILYYRRLGTKERGYVHGHGVK